MNNVSKRFSAFVAAVVFAVTLAVPGFSQSSHKVTVVLQDSSNGDPVGFATVSITRKGASEALKYALTDAYGKATLEKIPSGSYTVKAEMMGYVESLKEITVADKNLDLGILKMDQDREVLDAASVSAVGNPIVVKKDTIEYNASSFRITENDMLEDLLKKFPGIEVGSDGSITANGQKITKIYVDGKTYFMDDPTLASKNLPAKIIEKVKVINKKSDQAEFTGIDDGEEETVLDLSVQKGMMNGLMGNIRGGAGHDLPVDDTGYDDYRYSGNLFLGNFSNGQQYSVIGNVNNANSMGFGGFGGDMMRGMMGGGMGGPGGNMGGGTGVTTSYMLGANAGYDLFNDKMSLSGDYSLNGSKNDNRGTSYSENYYDGYSNISSRNSVSNTTSNSHNIGLRINHEFSKNSSIIFQPQISFGKGSSTSMQNFNTQYGDVTGTPLYQLNDGFSFNGSDQKSVSASGMLQYRQRLGLPGRTLVVNGNFRYSNTTSDGFTQSLTNNYNQSGALSLANIINQRTENNNDNSSLSMRATYTEPMGHNFYLEGNYSVNWSSSHQVKNAYDGTYEDPFTATHHIYNKNGEVLSAANSSDIINENLSQTFGADWLYQNSKLTAQIGVSLIPTKIHNKTQRGTSAANIDTTYSIVNWSPQIMVRWSASDRLNLRFNYRGSSSQPSVTQLIPVLDNTNPISQSLGNPYLNPYFSHNISSDIRFSNPRTFSSFNIMLNGGFTQNPIVNATWNENGKTFSMPVNGPTRGNASVSLFGNTPIARSNFSVSTNTSASTNTSGSFVGTNVGTAKYYNAQANTFDYALFRSDYPDMTKSSAFQVNNTRTVSFSENLTFTYRSDYLELRMGGGTRYSDSKYSINPQNNITTWSNNLMGSAQWNWTSTGLTFKSDVNYRWYNGFKTKMPSENIWNAEISKLILRNQATIALNVYDILGQTRNFSSTQSGNSYSESTNNSLGRYFLVQFTWRFGTFGGRNGRNSGGSRPERGAMPAGGMMPPMGGGMMPPMGGGFGGRP